MDGKSFRSWRIGLGLSQARAAAALGRTERNINEWERNPDKELGVVLDLACATVGRLIGTLSPGAHELPPLGGSGPQSLPVSQETGVLDEAEESAEPLQRTKRRTADEKFGPVTPLPQPVVLPVVPDGAKVPDIVVGADGRVIRKAVIQPDIPVVPLAPQEQAILALATKLYARMEQLTGNEGPPWDRLSNEEREFYELAVEAVLEDPATVTKAIGAG